VILETTGPCPSCGYPYASHVHYTEGESPHEIYCEECGFEWVQSRGNLSPDDEAQAHRGLREEAIAYQDPEDREERNEALP